MKLIWLDFDDQLKSIDELLQAISVFINLYQSYKYVGYIITILSIDTSINC